MVAINSRGQYRCDRVQTVTYLKKHPETVWLIAILAVSTLLRLAFIHEPFERDEGQYATIAQNILRGGLPYRDAIEIKPPGTFYLYALAISLFGATTEAVRTFTALYAMLTVISVYGVARQIAGVLSGLCAALVYGIFSTFPLLQGSSSNTEVFLVLPMTAGVWFFLKSFNTKKRSYLFGVGLCAAFAMLIKPVALPVVILEFLLIPFIRSGEGRLREASLDLAAFILPIAACAATTFGYFYLRGGLDDLLYWTVEFPRRYKESEAGGPSLGYVMKYLKSSLLTPILLGIPSAVWLAATRRDIVGFQCLLQILAVCLAIALPGKYFPHYFIMIIPFLAIPAGVGLDHISRMRRLPAVSMLLFVVAACSFSLWKNYEFYTDYSPERVSVEKYGTTLFVASGRVAHYLRGHTRPDDYIFQWGFEPELYFLADRRCPNPYLVSLLPGWSRDPQQAANSMMRSLIDKQPAYVVVQPEWSDFVGSPEVDAYLQMYCVKDRTIDYAEIYRCSTK